jgi:hypothetical protein
MAEILLRRSLPTFHDGPRFVSIQHRCTTEVRCTRASTQWKIECVWQRHIFPVDCALPTRIQWKAAARLTDGRAWDSHLSTGFPGRTLTSVAQPSYDRQAEGYWARQPRDSKAHCAEHIDSQWSVNAQGSRSRDDGTPILIPLNNYTVQRVKTTLGCTYRKCVFIAIWG